MRKVNQITWDLVRQEFDIPKVNKGTTVNVVKNCFGSILNNKIVTESNPIFIQLKAR